MLIRCPSSWTTGQRLAMGLEKMGKMAKGQGVIHGELTGASKVGSRGNLIYRLARDLGGRGIP
jgi:hypothetical protein